MLPVADTTLGQEPEIGRCHECGDETETVVLDSTAGDQCPYCRACLLDALAVFTASERVAGES